MKFSIGSGVLRIVAVLGLVAGPALAQDAPDPVGKWDVNVDMGGTPMEATLDVYANDDGTYGGVLNSPLGELELESVAYSPGETLSFSETIGEGDTAISFSFEGKFTSPDAFEGTLNSESLGVLPVKATRAPDVSPLAGIWDITSESQLGTLERQLVVYRDGTGKYVSDEDIFWISDLEANGADVSFDVTVSADGQELPLTFEGMQDADSLTGDFFMDGSDVADVTGVRVGTGDPAAGTWSVEADTPIGPYAGTLHMNKGGGGKLVSDEGESKLQNVEFDADMLLFDVSVLFDGQTYDVTFEGTVGEDTIEGEFLMGGAPVATVELKRQ